MRSIIFFILLYFTIACSARAEEHIYKGWSEFSEGAERLWDESKTVVTTPVDTEHNGLLSTMVTAATVSLTYLADDNIRNRVAEHKSDRINKATEIGSLIGNPFFHLGIAGVVYSGSLVASSAKYKSIGEMLGEAVILADATTLILKEAIGRERPEHGNDKGSFRPFQFRSDFDSLPSMHTASSFAMASVLAATSEHLLAKIGYYATAAFVGYSRVYQDKHWASDVVLGAAIGELCGRVVTSYHVGKGTKKLSIVPLASTNTVGMALLGRW